MTLEGKVAVITGSGLVPGSQIAIALAKSGAKVAVEGTEALLRNVEAFGGDALPMRGNFTDKNDVRFILSNVEAILGKVDILVHSLNIEQIDEATVKSITTFTETVIAQMKTQAAGHILFMAVTNPTETPEQSPAFFDSHQAIVQFSETISRSLSGTNINISLISLDNFQQCPDNQTCLDSETLVEEVINIVKH
jgi:3-oxoacyl-[acyl-carrier protein] reductase